LGHGRIWQSQSVPCLDRRTTVYLQDVFDEGLRFAKHVKGIGPNVLTEAMHTWNPHDTPQ